MMKSQVQKPSLMLLFIKSLILFMDHSDILEEQAAKMPRFVSIHAVPSF